MSSLLASRAEAEILNTPALKPIFLGEVDEAFYTSVTKGKACDLVNNT